MIVGAELTAPVAYRWKCQINENAGLPAFSSALPEADHNEVVGWPRRGRPRPVLGRLPRGPGRAPAQRAALRAHRAEARGRAPRVVERVAARGETPLERLVSLVLLGDLVSLYLAVLAGADPVDIGPIDRLKAR